MISIQQATSKDIDAIAALHTKSWKKSYKNILSDDYLENHALEDRQKVWQKRLKVENPTLNLNQCVLTAKDGESLVAFVCLFANYDEKFAAYLDNLHVNPDFQGRGLGKQLMQQAALWFVENTDNKSMFLWVFEANHDACKFYDALGGVQYEVSDELMPDGNYITSVRYVWENVSVLSS